MLQTPTTSLTWVQCITVGALLQHVIPGHSRDSLWIGNCLIEMLPRSHRKALSLPETWSLSEFPGHCHVALSLSKVGNSWSETTTLVREAGKYQWHTERHNKLWVTHNVSHTTCALCVWERPSQNLTHQYLYWLRKKKHIWAKIMKEKDTEIENDPRRYWKQFYVHQQYNVQ